MLVDIQFKKAHELHLAFTLYSNSVNLSAFLLNFKDLR